MDFDAAVLHEIDAPLTIERVTMRDLQPGDVLVRIEASGLCHTDLEVIQGSLEYPLPIVLGHEGAGVVEAVGAGVTLVKPGDHVVCSWNPNCGHCFCCDRDQPILCEPFTTHQPRGHLLDGTSRLTIGGDKLHHFSVMSSHAQYCVVPESGAIPVPDAIPFDRACLIGCGVMTGVGAVLNIAAAKVGDSAVILGLRRGRPQRHPGRAPRRLRPHYRGRCRARETDDRRALRRDGYARCPHRRCRRPGQGSD